MFEVINKKENIKREFNSKDEALNFIEERTRDISKTNINVSREVHRLLKNMKQDNESFDEVLSRILKDGGYLWIMMNIWNCIILRMIGI